MSEYRIGQIVPASDAWRPVGAELPEPVWHALRVPGGQEARCSARLTPHVREILYPVQDREYRDAQKRLRRVARAMVPGLIYVKFDREPRWHILRDRRMITGVICAGLVPVVLPPAIIAVVMGIPAEAARLAEAKAEMVRIRAGDKARMLTGPLAGLVVDVSAVAGGRVFWATAWGKGDGAAEDMERIAC